MGETILAIIIQAIPYLAPVLLGAVTWAAGKLWAAILRRTKNQSVNGALVTIGMKASNTVERLEQTLRPRLAEATADGHLTREEARELAVTALRDLLGIAGSEIAALRTDGGLTQAQVEAVATSALEAAVYRLPRRPERLGRPSAPVGTLPASADVTAQ